MLWWGTRRRQVERRGDEGDHAFGEIGVVGMLETRGLEHMEMRRGFESELEGAGLECGSRAMLDCEAQ
ncbi:MAG: hypothetical protein QOD06_2114 [Candidatus Binatota bacterium]|nr:hypothetical protein [Candidatus Binatota bacterium]